MRKDEESEHLFICFTPLHALFSSKIIERENLKNVGVVYLFASDSSKNRHYFNHISKYADYKIYLEKEKYIHKLILILFKIIWPYIGRKDKLTIYAGNPKTIFVRLPLFFFNKARLRTFDDGIGNIRGESYFYKNSNRFLNFIFPGFSYFKILSRIETHYTIYDEVNITTKTQKLNLFDNNIHLGQNPKKQETASILLLSTLSEDNLTTIEEEKALYLRVHKKFHITHYLAHPLNKAEKITNAEIIEINSDKIAEDVVLELTQEYETVQVIGFYSSTLLHLCNYSQIKCVNIELNLKDELVKTKELFRSRNIQTLRSEELCYQ